MCKQIGEEEEDPHLVIFAVLLASVSASCCTHTPYHRHYFPVSPFTWYSSLIRGGMKEDWNRNVFHIRFSPAPSVLTVKYLFICVVAMIYLKNKLISCLGSCSLSFLTHLPVILKNTQLHTHTPKNRPSEVEEIGRCDDHHIQTQETTNSCKIPIHDEFRQQILVKLNSPDKFRINFKNIFNFIYFW